MTIYFKHISSKKTQPAAAIHEFVTAREFMYSATLFFLANARSSAAMRLQIQDLTKSFRRGAATLDVLAGINLAAAAGEFVSVLGPSGCGKSTLFNLIVGLLKPDAGRIQVGGIPIDDHTGAFAYMQQKDLLLPWRTVLGNVLLGPEIEGRPRAEAREEAMQLLEQLGLKGFERSYPAQLSGGMRQRAALVRTLLLKKEMLLLDEPFGALDAMTRSVMQSILLDIRQQWRQTILLITHDVDEALLFSDRLYVLTARPATVKEEVVVPLPRPRSITDMALMQLKSRLLATLQTEMLNVFE
jgi:ABC-type nitrate/sulfonate/bicarbonate transport system ATPase subunit